MNSSPSWLYDSHSNPILVNTTTLVPRFVAETYLHVNQSPTKTHGVVLFRWLNRDLYEGDSANYDKACAELATFLEQYQRDIDLQFSVNGAGLGVILCRANATKLHSSMRALIQDISWATMVTANGRTCLIRQVLRLQVGWAMSDAKVSGREVLRLAEQRSYDVKHAL